MAGYSRVRFNFSEDDEDDDIPPPLEADEDPFIDGIPPSSPPPSAPNPPPIVVPPPPPPPPSIVVPPPPPSIVVPPPPSIVVPPPPPMVVVPPPPPPSAPVMEAPPPPPIAEPVVEVPAVGLVGSEGVGGGGGGVAEVVVPVAEYLQAAVPGLPPGYVVEEKEGYESPGTLKDFQVVTGFRDLWAAVLFMLHAAGVAGLGLILGLRGWSRKREEMLNWVPQLGAASAVGLLFALLWQTLFRLFLDDMIVWAMWMGVFALFSLGILLISTGTAVGVVGLVFVLGAVVQALFAYSARDRKEFATDMLAKLLNMRKRYTFSIFLVSYLGLMVAAAWQGVFILGVAGVMSQGMPGYYVFLLIVSLAWVMEVIKNVLNVTVSGVVATYYFQENRMPPGPTRHAFLQACSTAFGSICLGSTLVAPLQFMRFLVRTVSSAQGGTEFPFACCGCLHGVFHWLHRFFNKWAYVHVCIYGKSFVSAAKDTWDTFQRQGMEALLEDDLTNNVFFVGSFAGGSLSAIVASGWEWAKHKELTVSIALIAFFLGYFFTHISVVVYQSGMAAIFVCYAEDPETLRRHDPDVFGRMKDRLNYLKE